MDQIAQAVRYIYPSSNKSSTQRVPSKRRPASFSGFLGSHGANRAGKVGSLISTSLSPLLTPLNVAASRSNRPISELTSEDDDRESETPAPLDSEKIVFSSWASLSNQHNYTKHFLILGYEQGFQIWDTTQLDSIQELIHVRDTEPFNAPVFDAAFIDYVNDRRDGGPAVALLIGQRGRPEAMFVLYSAAANEVLYQTNVPCAVQVEANSDLIAIVSASFISGTYCVLTRYTIVHSQTSLHSYILCSGFQ